MQSAMSLGREEALTLILETERGFSKAWQAHRNDWYGMDAGTCSDMATFSRYVASLLAANPKHPRAPAIFALIERLMVEGNEEVQTAAATCFLENIQNRSPDPILPEAFVGLLGEKSRHYCRAWDEFTGVRTPGIWDEDEKIVE